MTPFETAARAHIASRRSEGTRELYTYDLDRWVYFCAVSKIKLDKPTLNNAAAFRDKLLTTLGAQTVRRTLAALSRMYRAALSAWPRAAAWNPFDAAALARPAAGNFSKTETVTKDEAAAVFAVVAIECRFGVRDTAILRILYDTGLRISAVTSLKRSKVIKRPDGTVIRVPIKGKDEADVELTAEAVEALDRWLVVAPASLYAFPAPKNPARAVSRLVMYKRLRNYGVVAGIARLHPHRFRASFITELLDAKHPLNEVQAAAHHSTPVMTQRYDRGIRGRGAVAALAKFRTTGEKS